jgi:thiamine pyrophosphate-dependent acetolactate synthase large subunit-like protein
MKTTSKTIPGGEFEHWYEMQAMHSDDLVRLVASAFPDFAALTNAPGYRPSIWLDKGQHRMNAAKREIARRYDVHMHLTGDPRRVYRGGNFCDNP